MSISGAQSISASAVPTSKRVSDLIPSARVDGLPAEWTPEVRRIMSRITWAGCLTMVYIELTGSSAQVEFAKKLGAREFDFGIIGAIPPGMLLFQFLSALIVNRMPHRKRLWIPLMVAHRFMMIPIALLPWILPDIDPRICVWPMLGLMALNEGMANLGVPVWYSWMADLLPQRSMGEFWAGRRRYLAATAAGTLLLSAFFFWLLKDVDIRVTYLAAAVLGSIAGICDVLCFLKIPESKIESSPAPTWSLLREPFLNAQFRRFIFFSAFWTFSITFCFPFFRLYLLDVIGLPLFAIMLLYFCHALGGTLFSATLGRMTDRMGQRPILILCTALKSSVLLAIFLVRPGWSVWLLIPFFVLDNLLNTGFITAHSNYIMKQSPRQNRSMFVAAVLATSGVAGAAASLLAGACLHAFEGRSWEILGMTWNNFHVVFGIGLILRWIAIAVASTIQDPKSKKTSEVIKKTSEAFRQELAPALWRYVSLPFGWLSRSAR